MRRAMLATAALAVLASQAHGLPPAPAPMPDRKPSGKDRTKQKAARKQRCKKPK